ncbi:hypothetical protein B0I35DRAFT_415466 [Stachybotrys elegans]|uniref:Uncharacterized protein n=1 Tax=Stachybotrys elegans TaxID=80388 RepID=A0A8K0SC56_9HYPO|nr:hypothetical protein B0I35DRAFT_415466 [Stachybotrys elegans]
MRETQVLGERLYHTKQINEDISRAIETLQANERSIESGAVAFNKKALANGISELKGALSGRHWPGAGSFMTALTSLVVTFGDDASKNMTDDDGNKVNKKFVVRRRELERTTSVNYEDTRKIAIIESQLKTPFPKSKQAALDEFTEASKARNNDIVAYTGGDYLRLRNDSRFGILRSVRKAALALRFWGLLDTARFDGPSLLSSLDEMEAHLGVLLSEYEKAVSRLSSFSRLTWAARQPFPVTLSTERPGARRPPQPYAGNGDVKINRVTVVVNGLKEPASRQTSFLASPFAGHTNVRISQVRFFAPGIRLASINTEKTVAEMRLYVELQHGGDEVSVDPDNVQVAFRHWPVQLASSYKWAEVVGAADIGGNVTTSRQVLPSDWMGANGANTHAQAPIGPFRSWRVTIRETVNGTVDWTGVSEAYLEFCGSSSPFR